MSEKDNNRANEPLEEYEQPLTFEKVWQMFQETDKQFKETDKKFQETDKKFQETDRQFKETNKKIKELSNLFTTQWGKLMEALIKPSCLKLFKERDIDINQTYSNVEVELPDEKMAAEFDILLANGSEVVVIEVKTTMRIEFVEWHLEKLEKIRKYFPRWADMNFYGAVAAIKYDEYSDKYAQRKGLFVLKSAGEGLIKIANPAAFEPKKY
ncbi:MAG: hypothetical protein K9I94_07975 [Bacteroidales bacterium]|nr:hypothetical protein [Bacteroidales bacterium]